jgi:hypothetical protein
MSAALQAVVDSHMNLGVVISLEMLDRLNMFFDPIQKGPPAVYADPNHNIITYIYKEHLKASTPVPADITYISKVHKPTSDDPMYILEVYKGNIKLIHLTIHIAPTYLDPQYHGMIHIVRNVYNQKKYGMRKAAITMRIQAFKDPAKPQSRTFKIIGSRLPPSHPNAQQYDADVTRESDILIKVLNNIFDEKKTHAYANNEIASRKVNNTYIPFSVPPHTHTNPIAMKINSHKQTPYSRGNKGQYHNIPAITPVIPRSRSHKKLSNIPNTYTYLPSVNSNFNSNTQKRSVRRRTAKKPKTT